MTNDPHHALRSAQPAESNGRTWIAPRLQRLSAGSAEVGANPQRPEGQIAFGGS